MTSPSVPTTSWSHPIPPPGAACDGTAPHQPQNSHFSRSPERPSMSWSHWKRLLRRDNMEIESSICTTNSSGLAVCRVFHSFSLPPFHSHSLTDFGTVFIIRAFMVQSILFFLPLVPISFVSAFQYRFLTRTCNHIAESLFSSNKAILP